MKRRLPIVLSVTALVIAVAGIAPLGKAAREATEVVRFARNADKVDGLHASRSPKAGRLLALNGARKFPASVLPATGLSGLEVLTAVSATDSSSPKALAELYPSSATRWTARAAEPTNIGASWTLTAYAFCAAGS
jgi:hypothetical protein